MGPPKGLQAAPRKEGGLAGAQETSPVGQDFLWPGRKPRGTVTRTDPRGPAGEQSPGPQVEGDGPSKMKGNT